MKKQLTLQKMCLFLSCVVCGPIYGRFMGFLYGGDVCHFRLIKVYFLKKINTVKSHL